MKIRAPWKTPAHDDQAPGQGYPPTHTSTLLDQTSRVWTVRETNARLAARGAQPAGTQADDRRSRGIQGHSRPGGTGSGAADEPAQTSGSPVSGSPADHLLGSATSGHTSDGPRTFTHLAPRVLSHDPTPPVAGLTTTTAATTNQTWIDPQSAAAAASPADASSSSASASTTSSRFGPMSLDGDEVVALLSGLVILILLLLVLLIWMFFRDPNRNASIDAESRHGLADTPPVITLTLEPSALPRSHQDVLGRAAETGPGAPNWPLSHNQIRIPLRPRPNRRTLSSELSPFGYIRRSNLSDVASSVDGGGGGSAPAMRPASISAAWLSPSRAMFGRSGSQRNSSAPSTAPAGPSSPVQQQQPLSTV